MRRDETFISQMLAYRQIILNDPEIARKADKEENRQLNEELRILETAKSCQFNGNIYNYNRENLHQLLVEQFYNPKLFSLIDCMMDYIVLIPDYDDLPGRQLRIRNFITNLKMLSQGVFGKTFEAGLLRGFQDFIIKTPTKENRFSIHEYFVGRYMNKMRTTGPNFVYTYAGFSCSPPLSSTLKATTGTSVVNWCARKTTQVKYIIQERISGPTLYQILPKLNLSQFMQIFLQLALALDEANIKLGFTHYDLHSNNIIIRELAENYSLYYPRQKNVLFISTQLVATIIDFGRAFISVKIKNKKRDFGRIGEDYGVGKRTFPLYDIFTLLVDCYRLAPNLRPGLKIMFQFFEISNPETEILDLVKKGIPLFLPPIQKWLDLDIQDFINFVQKNMTDMYRNTISIQATSTILSCQGLGCFSMDKLTSLLNLDSDTLDVSSNLLEVWDMLYFKNESERQSILSSYNLKDLYQQWLNMETEVVNHGKNLVEPKTTLMIELSDIYEIFDPEYQRRYFDYLVYLGTMTDILDSLYLLEDIQKIFPSYLIEEFDFTPIHNSQIKHNLRLRQIEIDIIFLDSELEELIKAGEGQLLKNADFENFYITLKGFKYQSETLTGGF